VQDPGEWVVTTKDGTKYSFGMSRSGDSDQALFDNLWDESAAKSQPVETLINIDNMTKPDEGGTIRRKVVKYLLREVEDTSGNKMFFEYEGETRTVRGCDAFNGRSNTADWVGQKWYHRATLPSRVSWGTRGDDASSATMWVDFGYNTRSDDSSWGDSGDSSCTQPQYSNNRLENIKVFVDGPSGDHLLRQYDLTHGYEVHSGDAKHLRLDKVSLKGKGNASNSPIGELFNQSFSYSQNHTRVDDGDPETPDTLVDDGLNGLRLVEARHSMGGRVTYKYQQFPVGQCKRSKDGEWSNCAYRDDKKRVLVKQHNVYDSLTANAAAVSSTVYGYIGGLERYDVRAGLTTLGHAEVTATVYDGTEEQAYNVNTFYQRDDGDAFDYNGNQSALRSPHPALGRPKDSFVWQSKALATASGDCEGRPEGGGRCLLSKTENRWETLTKASGTWQVATVFDTHPRWARAQTVETKVDGSPVGKQRFGYENTYGRFLHC